MNARAVLADDEPRLADYLADRLAALWPELTICGIAANGPDALAMIEREKPDLAFLDIKMPGMTGLEVAQRMSRPCLVVFITAYQKYAVESFEQEAVDYVLKPVSDERLARTIARVKKRLAQGERTEGLEDLIAKLGQAMERKGSYARYLRASSGREMHLIPVGKILYIKSDLKYTVIATRDGEFLTRLPISELIKQLDPERFWQVHRSTIVNASRVKSVAQTGRERFVLRLHDCEALLPVSRSYIHLFKPV